MAERQDDGKDSGQDEAEKAGPGGDELQPEQGTEAYVIYLKRKQSAALSAVTKQRMKINKMMADVGNLAEVKSELEQLNIKFERYVDAYLLHLEQLSSETIQDIVSSRYEQREKAIVDFRLQVLNWITSIEGNLVSQSDSVSQSGSRHSSSTNYASRKSSKSHKSRSSSSKSVSSSVKVRARIAELIAEREMLEKRHQLKAAEETYALDIKIAKARAREQTYMT